MDIKAYNTNMPVYTQSAQNKTEADSSRRQSPATDKTAVASGGAGSQQDAASNLKRGVLADAELKDTDRGGVSAVTKKVQDSAGKGKDNSAAAPETKGKAYFAVDNDKNVVIKVEDSKGNVVSQIPPEDYIKMSKTLKEISTNLFHTTA